MRVKVFKSIFIFSLLVAGVFMSSKASAITAYGENSRDVSRAAGATWYYYKITGSNYGPDDKFYVPTGSNNTKVAIPAQTCQSYGGFWVLLRNAYDGQPASAIRLSDISLNSNSLPSNTIAPPTNVIPYIPNSTSAVPASQNGISFVMRNKTMKEVLDIYNKYINTTADPLGGGYIGDLSYFCANEAGTAPTNVKTNLDSFSTVTIGEITSAPVLNGSSYYGSSSNSTVMVPYGEKITVTFRSYLARVAYDYQLKGGNASYQLNTDGSSRSGSVNFSDLNNGDRRWDINGVEYFYSSPIEVTRDFTITSTRTYCQTISYNVAYDASGNLTSGTGSRTSRACITFYPAQMASSGNPSGGVVTSCRQGGDPNSGSNIATVGVSKNGTKEVGSGFQMTTAANKNDNITIFAKPGDSIRFSYSICFVGRKSIPVNNLTDRHFEIFAGQGGGDDVDSLLFGKQFNLLGQGIGVLQKAIRNGNFKFQYIDESVFDSSDSDARDTKYKITSASLWNSSEKQLSFTSPDAREDAVQLADKGTGEDNNDDDDFDTEDGGTEKISYDCEYYTGRTTDNGGFVIPGLLPDYINQDDSKMKDALEHCNSAKALASSGSSNASYSAVGATIGQNLKYSVNSSSGTGIAIVSKGAGVKIPYNYTTNITGEIKDHDTGIVYPGEVVKYDTNVDILPRANQLTSDKEGDNYIQYATNTPPYTEVDLVEFLIEDNTNLDSIKDKLAQDYNNWDSHMESVFRVENPQWNGNLPSPNSDSDVCEFYARILGKDLTSCKSRVVKGSGAANKADSYVGNRTSDPKGEMGYYKATELLTVPDTIAGYKYCVATAINYGDSHGVPKEGLLNDNPNSPAYGANSYSVNSNFSNYTSTRWRVSNASCRTVAKKPSAEIWNGGSYSGGNIWSSVTKKSVNARLGDLLNGTPQVDKNDKRRRAPGYAYFGSWDEYYVVAKGSVYGLASASALGYTSNIGLLGGLASDGYGNPNGKDFCDLSRLTIANNNCKEGVAGELSKDPTEPNDIKKTIKAFYTPPDTVEPSSPPATIQGIYNAIGGFSSAKYYSWRNAHVIMSSWTGDQTIGSQLKNWTSGTVVIKVNGHLTIEDNICITEGTCSSISNEKDINNLSLENRNISAGGFDAENLSTIPQVIIIAKSISIGENVTQIDAWLVTDSDEDGYNGGFINTCAGFKTGETTMNTCWRTLKINGPVLTSELLLNRTGGAWAGYSGDLGSPVYQSLREKKLEWESYCELRNGRNYDKVRSCLNERIDSEVNGMSMSEADKTALKLAYRAADRFGAQDNTYSVNGASWRDLTCDGSITPAEIINLSPIVYFWAYSQSQQLGQAIITYAQELSPRY